MAKPNLTSLCTVLLNFAPDQLGRKRIYHYKRKFKYCPNIYCGHIAYLFTTVIEPKHNGVKLLFCSIWAAHSIFSRKTNPEFRIFRNFLTNKIVGKKRRVKSKIWDCFFLWNDMVSSSITNLRWQETLRQCLILLKMTEQDLCHWFVHEVHCRCLWLRFCPQDCSYECWSELWPRLTHLFPSNPQEVGFRWKEMT